MLIQSDAANAGDDKIHRRQRSGLCGTGLPICLHHDRLRRGLRISLADCLRHDAENDKTRITNPTIGYGAMVTEMMVALMAMIAACVLQPGEYFAINMKGAPTEVVGKVSAPGFPVTEARNGEAGHESRRNDHV